jgi:dTMP kinase
VEQVIRPVVEKNITVICDRYVDSFYAYQGFGRGIALDRLESKTNIAINGLMPDITFFLDLDPEIGLKRRMESTGSDRIENELMDFHRKVYSGYRELAKRFQDRIKTIDASRSEAEVWRDIRRQLEITLGFIKLV